MKDKIWLLECIQLCSVKCLVSSARIIVNEQHSFLVWLWPEIDELMFNFFFYQRLTDLSALAVFRAGIHLKNQNLPEVLKRIMERWVSLMILTRL